MYLYLLLRPSRLLKASAAEQAGLSPSWEVSLEDILSHDEAQIFCHSCFLNGIINEQIQGVSHPCFHF